MESRTGGANSEYTIILTFLNPLASVGGVAVTSGTGSVSTSGIGADAHQYMVNLTGVPNAQRITVSLTNVTDSLGNSSSLVAVRMGLLVGDSNGDGFVNAGDAIQTRNRSGQATDSTNFRSDVNIDGSVNSGDAVIVRGRSGTFVP